VIEFSRSVLIEGVVPTARGHVLLVGAAAASLAVGALVYRRLAPSTPEYL
jgi:ABC-type polysaccharide/polyol phosphate export permease